MAGQSEEKTLPASRKKLDDARKKGQVARSKDLTSGATLVVGLGFLLLGGGGILAASEAMFEQAGSVAGGDFDIGLGVMAQSLRHALLHGVAPLLLLVPCAAVLSAMAMLGGVAFSTDPIVPKFEKINPAEGFKRLFKLRSLLELVKSVLKTVLIVSIVVALLAGGLQALVLVPACGMGCLGGVFHALVAPLFGAVALLFVLAGLADVALQRWLFGRDQKMGVSEAKRERKDMDGDPELKRERRRLMREALRMSAGLGIRRATAVVHDPGRFAIGLRYKAGELPVPVVVCHGRDERSQSMLAEALRLKLPAVEDRELAGALYRVQPGHAVPEALFRPVALALTRAGAI